MTQPCSSTSARSNGTTSFSTARTSSIVPGSVSNRSLCCISTPIWALPHIGRLSMVPNKICRGQDFGGADFLLAVIAEQDFMGSCGHEVHQGRSDRAQHRSHLGSAGCATRPSSRVSASGDIGLRPLCNHGAITRPRTPQDRRTALKDTTSRHLSSYSATASSKTI